MTAVTHILECYYNGLTLTVEADGCKVSDGDINSVHTDYTTFEVIEINGDGDIMPSNVFFKESDKFISIQEWAEKNEDKFEIQGE